MRLSMLPIVARTAQARRDAVNLAEAVQNDDFVVSIAGNRQDDAMMAVAKPAILAELRGRVASLDRDLESYDVKLD